MSARSAALLAALLVVLAGCTGPGRASDPQDLSLEDPPASESEPDPHGELACDDATLEDIDATIGGQLEAFADDDYDAALSFTTEGFQEQFSADRLRGLIEEGFPLVADADGHSSSTCVEADGVAQLLVAVTAGDEELELVYSLELEDGEWRIAGATPAGDGSGEDDPELV